MRLLRNWDDMRHYDYEEVPLDDLKKIQDDLALIRHMVWDTAHKAFSVLKKNPTNVSAYLTADSAMRMLKN